MSKADESARQIIEKSLENKRQSLVAVESSLEQILRALVRKCEQRDALRQDIGELGEWLNKHPLGG